VIAVVIEMPATGNKINHGYLGRLFGYSQAKNWLEKMVIKPMKFNRFIVS